MPYGQVVPAFAAEASELAKVAASLTEADLDRPSRCPPWTTGGLLCHVLIAVRRISEVRPDDGPGELVSASGYYTPDQRFSEAVNADRIDTAAALAASLRRSAAISAALDAAWREGQAILLAAPPDRAVRTRHGDRMLLTEFARTRVVEVAVHGLDLATALGRPPWMTAQAADVVEDLLVPDGAGPRLRAVLGCDQAGLIARLTGRLPLTAAQRALLQDQGVAGLALG
jgi:uncharacterized protein (TIGR03083 family)